MNEARPRDRTKAKRLSTGAEARLACRRRALRGTTAGVAMEYAQANLVVLPRAYAFDFLLFCHRNPKPCPLLDVTDPGSPEPRLIAKGADVRTDLPKYRVYRDGRLTEERDDIADLWQDDFVSFFLGCSYTFEYAMLAARLPVRHIEQGTIVPMYITNRSCHPAGAFHGPLVVSMRPLRADDAIRATEITSRFPRAHGAPVHFGAPEEIGIAQLDSPDFGDRAELRPGEVPVFWACGVTPQAVAMSAKPHLMITHAPGCMFISDLRAVDLSRGA